MFWYILCYSVAADKDEYVTVAATKDAAVSTIPLFMRQDFEVRPATEEEIKTLKHK